MDRKSVSLDPVEMVQVGIDRCAKATKKESLAADRIVELQDGIRILRVALEMFDVAQKKEAASMEAAYKWKIPYVEIDRDELIPAKAEGTTEQA